MILDVNERRKRKHELGFPDLLEEGKKYGLNNQQLSRLTRYLNDKRLLKVISLEQFRQNAKAWFAALTGIVAEVLAMDAHVSIWMDKKLERPRNWVLSKLNEVIPTKIDDIAIKALTSAQNFTDEVILPIKEEIFSNLSSKMHDKYQYHVNSNHLGYSLKELKELQKANLKESKEQAQDALKTLKQRQFQSALLHGMYKDEDGYWHNASQYQSEWNKRWLNKVNERIKTKNETKQETPKEGKVSNERQDDGQGNYP